MGNGALQQRKEHRRGVGGGGLTSLLMCSHGGRCLVSLGSNGP
jgi:hypothetical protein